MHQTTAGTNRVLLAPPRCCFFFFYDTIELSYWQLGGLNLKYQQEEGWGAKIIDRLAADIRHAFPDMSGFSARNMGYMKKFVEASLPLILQHPVAKLPSGTDSTPTSALSEQHKEWESKFLSSPLAQISWSHHVILLDKVKEPLERLWYMEQTIQHGWGRNMLRQQIDSKLYHRQVKANKVNNFTQTLPSPQSDLAQQLLKDPYVFDFVSATAQAKERDIENQLVSHVTKFLLELGQGFAFVGRQYPLKVGDRLMTTCASKGKILLLASYAARARMTHWLSTPSRA